MLYLPWTKLLNIAAVFSATILVSANAMAATPAQGDTDENQQGESDSLSQVTSVSQFSDVQPTDWAFQALQSLVERYGCIAGYPNSTFQGNQALSRYEFAAGLNACLDRVNELIATGTADLATKNDLATIDRLQEEFKTELAALRGRVDALEARDAQLESHQFSTTTKLVGEAIFAVTDNFGNGNNNNTAFQDRVRLDLQTSFTGKDTLHTRIAAGNGTVLPGNTPEATQTFNLFNGANNSAYIDWLAYYFPVGKSSQVYVAASGGIQSDYVPTLSPYFQDYDGGNGALSTFASESPIYRIGGGSGAGINFDFSNSKSTFKPSLTLGYLASEANNPGQSTGLFQGNYAGLAQLNLNVGDKVSLAATYVHGYHGTGSDLFDGGSVTTPVVGTTEANIGVNGIGSTGPYVSNSYGFEAAFRPTKQVSVSGFLLYSDITGLVSNGSDEVWSYGLGVAFPDLGKKGNVLGIFAGAQPYAGSNTGDKPYHIEGFYKYRVSDNISITPGIIWLTNPDQTSTGSDAVIGTVRTTFTF
jgi:hypothetical protein